MNTAHLENWFLITYHPLHKDEPTESLFEYFVLPTTATLCLFGHTYNDSRANTITTQFTDQHRLITGDLVTFTPKRATTLRTVYDLGCKCQAVFGSFQDYLKT